MAIKMMIWGEVLANTEFGGGLAIKDDEGAYIQFTPKKDCVYPRDLLFSLSLSSLFRLMKP